MPKVLIIEDELDLLEMYKMQFEATDLEVFTADNLESGLKLAKSEKPDVMLLDLLLSQKEVTEDNDSRGGYVLLKQLKADDDTKDIKVIIFSNLDTQDDREEAMRRGAFGYLIKSETVPKEVVGLVKKIVA